MSKLKNYFKLPIIWILLLFCLLSFVSLNNNDSCELIEFECKEVLIKGDIDSDVDYSSERVRVYVNVREICTNFYENEHCFFVDSKVVTWLPRYPKVIEDDNVNLYGKLNLPEDFENNEDFSYKNFLLSKGVGGVIYRPSDYQLMKGSNSLKSILIKFREWAIDRLKFKLPEPHSSLLVGILLGVEGTMPEDFNLALRYTGTTHIIAASGYNVTIIANSIVSTLSFISRKIRLLLSIIFVWIFVFVSGGSIPVLRAALMLSYSLIAKILGRKSLVLLSLLFSAVVLVLLDSSVLGSVSFQLSFASTLGLIYLEPLLSKVLSFMPDWLVETVSVTLAAILSTLPITLFNFGELSILALPVNILVLPVVEIVMFWGLIYLVLPNFLSIFKGFIGVSLWVPLDYFVKVVSWFGNFKFSSIKINFFNEYYVIFYYFVILVLIIFNSRRFNVAG